jgi:hypothetical protein
VNRAEKRAAAEQLARDRAVRGWAFRLGGSAEDLAEKAAIRAFLDGGPCPGKHRASYALARQQLHLDPADPADPDLQAAWLATALQTAYADADAGQPGASETAWADLARAVTGTAPPHITAEARDLFLRRLGLTTTRGEPS